MPWAGARLLAAALLIWVGLAGASFAASPASAGSPILLADDDSELAADGLARAWIDPRGTAGIAEILDTTGPVDFQPAAPQAIYRLGGEGALWLHLRLQRSSQSRLAWQLQFPMPLLDLVTVYQREGDGWHAESAGDTLAVNRWPEPGLYPVFRLDLPAGEVRDVYVRIHHARGADFPMRLATSAWHAERVQYESMGLGAAFGAMLLLMASCGAWAWVYRDRAFAWYALYTALTSLAVAAFTGVAAHLLWPGFDALGDALTPMLACAAV
ncbi:MAG TPA: 7TM-DISM domain-containing protein, partial [Ramlibacter sp.]|nr:7TM-DISM domain-containing protein [Ramlibacter sp.]